MPRSSQRLPVLLVLLTAAFAVAAPAGASACTGADALPSQVGTATAAETTVCLVNAERTARGLRPVRTDRRLATAARRHGADMVARGYFSHVAPGGSTAAQRILRTGWGAGRNWSIGENLAWGTGSRSTPRATVTAWLESPGHRRVLLTSAYRQVGLAVTPGAPRPGDAPATAMTYSASFGS